MSSFNHFNVKRQAHKLSRQESAWNPFGHTWQFRKPSRRETWDGASAEAQEDEDERENGSAIHHSQTAPHNRSPTFDNNDDVSPDFTNEHTGSDVHHPTQDSNETAVDSQPSPTQDGVRERKGKGNESEVPPTQPDEDHSKEGKKDKKEHRLFKSVKPKEPYTVANQLRRTILNSWVNVLLIFAPVGIAINFVPSINKTIVFVINFIAIIPLAAMLSFATEEIALRTGETLGGLLNATFGNAVELIVAVLALTQPTPKVIIVQTSLIGSVLSNLLLVMGMCFFFGGLRRREQYFNTTVAQTAASLLALAVSSIIIPTVFDWVTNPDVQVDVPSLSRGTAVILLVIYGAYLFFQLKTHQEVFAEESQKVPAKPMKHSLRKNAVKRGMVGGPAALMGAHATRSDPKAMKKMMQNKDKKGDDDDDDHEYPQLHFLVAIATLTISTVIIALCAEFMVDGIDSITQSGGLSEEFVGLILLPIVGNAAEHATAVTVAVKDKMDLAIGVAVGSSMQVALFLIPLLVVVGWGMHVDNMTLSFDLFQVAVVFVAVLLVNYLIADGKSHWLEGLQLVALYFIIAVCAWYYPAKGAAG